MLVGIDLRRTRLLVFALSGTLAGLGGIVLSANLASADPNLRLGYELDVIAAVILGGTSLSGGRGLIPGVVLGAVLMALPTHGVDIGAKSDIYGIIRAEARGGRTILLASSETEEIMTLCDRVAVLSKGRLAGVLSRAEMSEAAMVDLAFHAHRSAA